MWTTGIGYVTSITVYQAAVFSRDPMGSGLTLAVCGAGVALAVAVMWFSGRVQGRRMQSPMPAE